MFKRLNTGGSLLTEQQVRNCTIRLLDPKFNDFIIDLSKNEYFKICTQIITYEQLLSSFDQELVLRFFAFKNALKDFKHDVADFLTDYMESVSDKEKNIKFDYALEKKVFEKTFEILSKTLGDKIFGSYNKNSGSINRAFGVYHYEALAIGIQKFIDRINPDNEEQIIKLSETFLDIKTGHEFVSLVTGGGKNSPGQLKNRISYVEEKLSKIL